MLIASEQGSRTIFLTDEESDFLFLDLYLILSELESESSPYSSSSSSSSDSGPELSSVSRIRDNVMLQSCCWNDYLDY